jgi:hypothetical protein
MGWWAVDHKGSALSDPVQILSRVDARAPNDTVSQGALSQPNKPYAENPDHLKDRPESALALAA